jgi:hypothetical protein
VQALMAAAEAGVVELVRAALGQLVPEYRAARPPPARIRGAEGADEGVAGLAPAPRAEPAPEPPAPSSAPRAPRPRIPN